MSDIINILLTVIGLPVAGLTVIFTSLVFKNWWIRARELRIKEEQMRLEAKSRDSLANEKIIEAHSQNISNREMEIMLREVRQLRDEVMQAMADNAVIKDTNQSVSTQSPADSGRQMHDRVAE